MGENLYSVLGVPKSASSEQIRRAYLELALKYHPDTNPVKENAEIFLVIQHAYDVLSDHAERKLYDESITVLPSQTQAIELNWLFSRSEVPKLNEPQMIYAKLDIKYNKTIEEFSTPPTHLCLVLDRSTSMKGDRLNSVRENLRQFISALRSKDLISIVIFNDKAEILIAPTTNANKQVLFEKISSIKAAGGTEIYKGLKAGIDLLWQGDIKTHLPTLLLLTDGHTYGDEENCVSLAKKAIEKNIKITALGFGNEWNDKFLDEITGITGGSAYYVRNLFDLPNFFQITLNSLSTTIAHNTNLEIRKNDDCQLKFIFRLEPEIFQLQLNDPIQMGNLIKEKKSSYLFAFELQPSLMSLDELDVITGKVRFVMSDIHNRYAEQDISIRLLVSEKPSRQPIPLEIIQALSRVNLFQMQEKSKQDVENGNINDAVRRLTFLATHLIGQGNVPFAKEVLNEAESIKKDQAYSEDGIKRLKYGTRALLQLPEPEKRK
jgi:Ca-activated chloride channel family protein